MPSLKLSQGLCALIKIEVQLLKNHIVHLLNETREPKHVLCAALCQKHPPMAMGFFKPYTTIDTQGLDPIGGPVVFEVPHQSVVMIFENRKTDGVDVLIGRDFQCMSLK